MPAPNDLTPEEEAEFAQHGVPSAGPGREPLADDNTQGGQQQQQGSEQQQQQGRETFHRDNGQFASREERDQGQARPNQRQQQGGEQQQQQGGQQQQQGGEEEQGGEQRVVPLTALQQERQARQTFARRAQLAETRLNAILSRQQQGGAQQEQMPDINEDPAGYILAIENRLKHFEQERTEAAQTQQIDSAINTDEDTYTQMQPDYPQASDYFVQSRARELLAFHPPQEAQRIMLDEARQIARQAWERGQSAAEVIYSLAQARGYNPNMAQQGGGQQQQQGGGQQQGGPRAIDVVRSVQQGQQASRSLSSGGGASAESLNANAILDMSDDEFARWLGEGGDATKRFAGIG